MKLVRAVREGFYNGSYREIGDEFHVPDHLESTWFAPEGQDPLIPDFEVEAPEYELPEGHKGGIIDAKADKLRKLQNKNISMQKRLDELEAAVANAADPVKEIPEIPEVPEVPELSLIHI